MKFERFYKSLIPMIGVMSLGLTYPVIAQSYMPMGSFEAVAYPVAITPLPLNTSGARSGATGAAAAPRRAEPVVQTTYRAQSAVTQRVKRQFTEFVGRNGGDAAGLAVAMEREDFFARGGR